MEQGNPYTREYAKSPAYSSYEEELGEARKRRRDKKKKVAKVAAKRGSVYAGITLLITQIALAGGASNEVLGMITPDNVGLVVGGGLIIARVAEALVADGKEDS